MFIVDFCNLNSYGAIENTLPAHTQKAKESTALKMANDFVISKHYFWICRHYACLVKPVTVHAYASTT